MYLARVLLVTLAIAVLAEATCDIHCGCDSCLDGNGPGCFCDSTGWVINEVLPGSGGWIEFVNVGETRNLAGASIVVDGKTKYTFGDVKVGAGQAAIAVGSGTAKSCGAEDPDGLASSTGSVVVLTHSALDIKEDSNIQIVNHDGDVVASFDVEGAQGGSVTLSPDVVGAPVAHEVASPSGAACSPGARADGEFFRRLLISEVMVDPGFNDLNHDGVSNTPVARPYGGLQDGFVEIVNQECYSVDLSGFELSVQCPSVCKPTADGCVGPASQAFTPLHLFPEGTVLPPGGAVVVFNGYNNIRGGSDSITFNLEESADFGYSLVQIASLPKGYQYPQGNSDDSRREKRSHGSGSESLSDLLAVLPCQACDPSEQDCDNINDQLLVGPNPTISYAVRSAAWVDNVVATLPLLNVIPGVSFTHVPAPDVADFRYHCIGDDCGADPSCSSAGYKNDGDVWSAPDVVGLKTVPDVDGCSATPGTVMEVTVDLQNLGDMSAYNVHLVEPVIPYATLVAGSVRLNGDIENCVVLSGNRVEDTHVEVLIPELCICADRHVSVTYQVLVSEAFECAESGVVSVSTQGNITWDNGPVRHSVTSSTESPWNNPTIVNYCVNADLEVSVSNVDDCQEPGSIFAVPFSVKNVGNAATCALAGSVEVNAEGGAGVSCQAPILPESLAPGEWYSGELNCSAWAPYPQSGDHNEISLNINEFFGTGSVYVCVVDAFRSLKLGFCENECCTNGDIISYNVSIDNNGNRASWVSYTDENANGYDVYFVVGSVTVSPSEGAEIVRGNTWGDTSVEVHFANFLPGANYVVNYQWMVPDPIPTGTGHNIENQGTVSWRTAGGTVEDSYATTSSEVVELAPTWVCVSGSPAVTLEKSCSSVNDTLSAGDEIFYIISVHNSGNQNGNVRVSDHLDETFLEFTGTSSGSPDAQFVDGFVVFDSVEVFGNNGTALLGYYATVKKSVPTSDQNLGHPASAKVSWGDEYVVIESDSITCGTVESFPVLTLEKSCASEDPVDAGDNAVFAISIYNNPLYGSTQTVSDWQLHEDSTYCNLDASSVSVAEGPDGFEFSVHSVSPLVIVGSPIAVDEKVTFHVNCKTLDIYDWDTVSALNSATVVYETPDGSTSVSATSECALGSPVDIKVEKSCPEELTPGEYGHFSVKVSNGGARNAHDVKLFDVFDASEFNFPTDCSDGYHQIVISHEGGKVISQSCDYTFPLSLGDLHAYGGCVQIDFYLQVPCPVQSGAELTFQNTAYVTYYDKTVQVSSDCDEAYLGTSESSSCPTDIVNLTGENAIIFFKTSVDKEVSPEQSAHYKIQVINYGNQYIDSFTVTDDPSEYAPKNYLTLDAGSVTTNFDGCTIESGNYGGDSVAVVKCVNVPGTCANAGSEGVAIWLSATLADGKDDSEPAVCNQAHLDIHDLVSDNPNTAVLNDPTCTAINYKALFAFDVVCTPVNPSVGEIVDCTVTTLLAGTEPGVNLLFNADFDPNLTLIPGSVVADDNPDCPLDEKRVICEGNYVDNTRIRVFIGTMQQGGTTSYSIAFKARVTDPYTPSTVFDINGPRYTAGFVTTIYTAGEGADVPTCYADQICDVTAHSFGVSGVNPQLVATKTDSLSASGGVRPGQNIQYTVSVSNTGNCVADVTIVDPLSAFNDETCIGAALELLPGTVDTNRGTIQSGNYPGDVDVNVVVGTLKPWESVTVIFEARVADPFPCVGLEVVNQAVIHDENLGSVSWSDDPNTDPIGDATTTPVDARPLVSSTKAVSIDGTPFSCNGCSPDLSANAGDVLVYELSVINDGNQAAFDVVVTDCLDPAVQFVPNTVYLNGDWVDPANILDVDTGAPATENTRTFQTNIGGVAGYDTSVLVFQAVVSNNIRSSTITNQAIINGDNFAQVFSTAPDSSLKDIPTTIGVNARPNILFTKEWAKVSGEGQVVPGDQIGYRITALVREDSTALAFNAFIEDTIDASVMSLDLGSVYTSSGTVLEGNNAGDANVRVQVDEIGLGEDNNVTVYFTVTLVSSFPAGVNSASNQATISGDNFPEQPSDDPSTPVFGDATVVSVWTSPVLSALPSAVYDGRTVDETNPVPPGQKLTNVIEVSNSGTQDSADTVLTVEIDRDTTFIPGSVTVKCTDTCKVVQGNRVGDAGPVVVSLGTLSAGSNAAATVSFSVTVNNPFGGRSPVATFPVLVESSNANDFNVDSQVAVDAKPSLSISMTCDKCLTGAPDCGGALNPGTILQATATITNKGNQDAFDVFFLNNPLPPIKSDGPAYDVYPTSLAGGLESIPDADGNGSLIVTFPRLPGGGQSIQFSYTLIMTTDPPVGDQLTQNLFVWSNDGTAEFSGEFPCSSLGRSRSVDQTRNAASRKKSETAVVRTNALARQGSCPPTFVPCSGLVNTVAACGNVVATISKDNDKDGTPSTGDVMLFSVTLYIQSSCSNLDGVTFQDIPDPINSRLVVGTTRTTLGQIISGNAEGDGSVILALGELPGNRQIQVAVSFEVLITGNAAGFRTLTNWGEIGINRYGVYQINDISPEVQFTTNVPGFQSSASQVTLSVAALFFALVAALF